MRDIRTDLAERLASLDGRYADAMVDYDRKRDALDMEHRETIEAIRQERSLVEGLLSVEAARASEPLTLERRPLVPLMDFLIAKVCAHGPITKDNLRAETDAAGYFDEGNGRAFHTTLLNVVRSGKVSQLPNSSYVAPLRTGDIFTVVQDDAEYTPPTH